MAKIKQNFPEKLANSRASAAIYGDLTAVPSR